MVLGNSGGLGNGGEPWTLHCLGIYPAALSVDRQATGRLRRGSWEASLSNRGELMDTMIRNKGFTLVELLLAVFILALAIGGALLLFVSSMVSSEMAWDTTVATSHAQNILEEMQTRPTREGITSVDWHAWADAQGLNTLPGEKIDVVIVDPSVNPLNIHLTVHWTRKLRVNEVVLVTKMAK